MSWRFIFAILVVIAGAAAWGGLRLGDWLVAHGPAVAITDTHPALATVAVLDANGKPFLAQPPQPLVDGRLAVPQASPIVEWEIPERSLEETKSNDVIAVATTPITMVEAQNIASTGGAGQRFSGIADVGDLMGGGRSTKTTQPIQPIEDNSVPVQAASRAPVANPGAWQASLRQDLQACSVESFFDRPSCAWAARNKYCTPNNAWGQVSDCPDKKF